MSGLLEWSNSIRFAMANDSGRKLFQDQVRTHGFAFLDRYLDNILSGPIHDPLIELVKTPGRKKVVRTKLLLAENHGCSKENQPPMKLGGVSLNLGERSSIRVDQTVRFHQVQDIAQDSDMPLAAHCLISVGQRNDSSMERTAVGLLPGRTDPNDLSIIAEGDENVESSSQHGRQSNANMSLSSDNFVTTNAQVGRQTSPSALHVSSSMDLSQDANVSGSASDIFQSIALDSHTINQDSKKEALSVLTPNGAGSGTDELKDVAPGLSPLAAQNSIEEQAAGLIPPGSNVMPNTTMGLEFNVPLRDPDRGLKSIQKFDLAPFPALPAPMPLRKSIRETSLALGATTPGALAGGKRTSWLQKVREANALEVTGKHVAVNAPLITVANPLKRKSDEMFAVPAMSELGNGDRQSKAVKIQHQDSGSFMTASELPQQSSPQSRLPAQDSSTGQERMLDLLRKTVEVLGAKAGKSIVISPGSKTVAGAQTAVDALAEARAAAEVRVAERQHEMTQASGYSPVVPSTNVLPTTEIQSAERRLSVSDLFPPNDGSVKLKNKFPVSFSFSSAVEAASDHSISHDGGTTTPPISPPKTYRKNVTSAIASAFDKPSPVFVPPDYPKEPSKDSATKSQSVQSPSLGATALNIPAPPALPLASTPAISLSTQSTLESLGSEVIFDDTDVPAWVPNTQDTEYLSDSQSQNPYRSALDEDDSWPVDEKFASGVQWTFGHTKEDSLTWSTLPSQSQGPDTGSLRSCEDHHIGQPSTSEVFTVPGAVDLDVGNDGESDGVAPNHDKPESLTCEKAIINSAESIEKREAQTSMVDSQSSQPNTGFLSQASKLLNSALGANKKGKPEVKKVLQMAAVAAKKQQEENDKKAARLKEMENRRQLAIQRKADEEKARAFEQEKKIKDEGERRKREREETTEKRQLKAATKKEEDNTKKRKLVNEGDKKELKKPLSKAVNKPSLKLPSVLASSFAAASLHSTSTSKITVPKIPKSSSGTAIQKGKDVAKQPLADDDISQPSQLVQVQMAARVKAQLHAAAITVPEPPIASESIELPEINSEYSDSEDEDRPKAFPEWAQSPELREALQIQSTINPDDIFGAVRPLRMEELFKTRTSRFRARTSSANWTGTDRLTTEEEQEYIRRMGYK